MDVDLRKLRYFLAVAEELHFGRAAERLHIAQPVLSRQIRALEHELGTELFTRDRRSTVLTPAGEQLVHEAEALLANAAALLRRVRAAGEGVTRFTIGFMPGITLTPVVRRLREQPPRARRADAAHRLERPGRRAARRPRGRRHRPAADRPRGPGDQAALHRTAPRRGGLDPPAGRQGEPCRSPTWRPTTSSRTPTPSPNGATSRWNCAPASAARSR
jgi:hypothetical protein